ncbi:uncharacterized protein EAF01_010245 [Botrytis porri]|uniref:uncharacterized protein n=1 Tax=Botrytis porri TaxID=87229 RepID=UPI001902567E|nr:uncharacterized protein EAF01_010245 [Botrytis porri]KAF7892165.1 hypothetical protein EAF01_010245 [Botrytis porri]
MTPKVRECGIAPAFFSPTKSAITHDKESPGCGSDQASAKSAIKSLEEVSLGRFRKLIQINDGSLIIGLVKSEKPARCSKLRPGQTRYYHWPFLATGNERYAIFASSLPLSILVRLAEAFTRGICRSDTCPSRSENANGKAALDNHKYSSSSESRIGRS